MAGFKISGSGRYLPGRAVSNHDLARVMDTSDEWIQQRTGIVERYFAPPGVGVAELALPAAKQALEEAQCSPEDLDYIVFNTMTPDHMWPGSGALLGASLGCPGVPAIDLRAQCAAYIFSLEFAAALFHSRPVRRILLIGAEAHAAFMPWRDWDVLYGEASRKPSPEDWERATRHRGWAIIFGDGAGALLLEATDDGSGLVALDLHTDGRFANQLFIPMGFRGVRDLPAGYASGAERDAESVYPKMEGREVFKHAVTKLPRSIEAACKAASVTLDQIDWFVGHQANARINDAVAARLEIPAEKMPSNIDRYGNTSSATIPILLNELRADGRLKPGQLICLFALGAGFHWGTALVRV